MISYSINRQVKNKPGQNQMSTLNSRFERVNGRMEDLLEEVKKGHAFCIADLSPDPKSGYCHRIGSNFQSCQLIAVDIDNSVSEQFVGEGHELSYVEEFDFKDNGKVDLIRFSNGIENTEHGEIIYRKRRLGSIGGDESFEYRSFEETAQHQIVRDYASFMYTSASHTDEWNRFRIVFVLPEKIYEPKRVSQISKYIASQFGRATDTATVSAVQCFYGSQDCKAIFFGNELNQNTIDNAYVIEEETKREEYKIKFNKNPDVKITQQDIITMLNYIPKQQDYMDWVRVISAIATEFDEETTVSIVENWSRGEAGEVRVKYRNRLKDISIGTLIYLAKKGGYSTPKEWYKEKSGKRLSPSRAELREFLQGFAQWRRNVMKNKIIEYKQYLTTEWIQVENEHVNSILESIEELTHFKVNKTLLEEVIDNVNLSENYHPIIEYFNDKIWDKHDRFLALSECLIVNEKYFENGEESMKQEDLDMFYDYAKNLFRLWFRAAYACGIYGIPNELMIILQGKQGIGKTRFVKHIYPTHLDWSYYYAGSILDNKDTISRLSKKFFYVDDEMEGMKKTDINFFKSLLSQDKVTLREVYAKRDSTMNRTASFLGSVNKEEFLKDEENRRFPVLAIKGVDFKLLNEINVEQLWAQAKEEYESGLFKPYADADMRDTINKFNEKHYMQSDVTYYIQRYIGKPQKGDKKDSIQTLNVTEIKIHIQQAHKAATDIMIADSQLNRNWIKQELERLGYISVNHRNIIKYKVKVAPIDSYDKQESDSGIDRIFKVNRLN